jgi:hypothetical protein
VLSDQLVHPDTTAWDVVAADSSSSSADASGPANAQPAVRAISANCQNGALIECFMDYLVIEIDRARAEQSACRSELPGVTLGRREKRAGFIVLSARCAGVDE